MLHIASKRIPCLLGFLPWNFFDLPKTEDHTSRSYYIQADENETGLDRLYNMFSIDEFGNNSPEMNFVMQGTFTGIFVGVVWGGFLKSRMEYTNFLQRNDATKFPNIFEAQRKLQDTVMLSFARGAYYWGWRLGFFTGSYVLITTTIAVYRGRSSLVEYATAGCVSGAFYKAALGPKGMLAGGVVGGIVGGVAGLISLGILRMSGTTMEEIRYWQYNWKKDRDRQIQSALKKARAAPTPIEEAHDASVKDVTELIPETECKA